MRIKMENKKIKGTITVKRHLGHVEQNKLATNIFIRKIVKEVLTKTTLASP